MDKTKSREPQLEAVTIIWAGDLPHRLVRIEKEGQI